MAVFIETDIKILIDPGTSLAPKRFGLPPSEPEFEALKNTRSKIQEYAKFADVIIVSHYHYDHFTPFKAGKYLDSSSMFARELYENKRLFLKHPSQNINKSQEERANVFIKNLKELDDCEIEYADGKSFRIGDTQIKFSEPLPHGPENTRLGYVIAATLFWEGESLMYASDVQGPVSHKTKQLILDENPDMLVLSGPPIYLLGFAIGRKDVENAKNNLIDISNKIPMVVVDHHLLRDLRCFNFLKSVKKASDGKILIASEILDKEPNLLEARRKEFFKE